MADFGINGNQQSNGAPYVEYAKGTGQNQPSAYINQGFTGSHQTLTNQQNSEKPAAKSAAGPAATQAASGQSSSALIAVVIGIVVVVVILGVAGAVIGVVLAGQADGNANPYSEPTDDTTSSDSTQSDLTSHKPLSTSASQPQSTPTNPHSTVDSQPDATTTHQQQTTTIPNPQTTSPPIEGDILNTKICGTQPVISNRILGGTDAQIGHWPWIGSLQTMDNDVHSCGASLLSNRWAVTATHCFDNDVDPDRITFGLTSQMNPGPHAQSSEFTPFHHSQYDPASANSEYDISLLKLHTNIVFTDYVRPICLSTLVEETQKYTNCQAAGWGSLVDPDTVDYSDYPDALQELDLPLISSANCQIIDSGATDNIICAGGTPEGGKDTCQADSGGPLICTNNQDESWHLVGIVSTGSGCGRPNTPAFYTRITRFIDWIQMTIDSNS